MAVRPSPVPHGYSTRALADDLEAVLDATLEPGRKAVLGGHSMGGMTLMAAGAAPPYGSTEPPYSCAAPGVRA